MAYDKVVDSAVLDGYFSDIADAIRGKGGSGTFTPAQMPQAIEDLPSGGNDPDLIALLAGEASGDVTIRGVTDLRACRISFGMNAHGENAYVTSLSMPDLEMCVNNNLEKLSGGFVSPSYVTLNLKTLNLPKCRRLAMRNYDESQTSAAFKGLEVLNAPEVDTFYGTLNGSSLREVSFPKLSFVRDNCFRACANLTRASFDVATSIKANAFYQSALVTITAPAVTNAESSAFYGCASLQRVEFPAYASQITNSLFSGCTSLECADMWQASSVATMAFKNCSALVALVLRRTTLASLAQVSAFTGTAIEAGTGYIYVPRDLIATYQAATNWATYATQFRAIEDYTNDGTLSGEFILPAN